MEIHSPVNKKFWVQLSVKKIMLTVFWYRKESITIDFLEKGTTVNNSFYCQLLWQYLLYLLNDPHIYMYIYIYCHPQTDCFIVSQLFSEARHVGHLKLGLKPDQLYIRLSIIQLNQQTNHVSSGIIRHYVIVFICLHFCLTGYQSA